MKLRNAAPFLALLAASVAAAPAMPTDTARPPAGSYGFNWLDPDSECREITEADLEKVASCEANDNAFGLSLHSHACKVDADTELMIYADAAQCQEALETMQANGP